jgi:hypothetical protein
VAEEVSMIVLRDRRLILPDGHWNLVFALWLLYGTDGATMRRWRN